MTAPVAHRPSVAERLRGLGALVVLVVLALGTPVGLAPLGRPWPARWPSWAEVSDALVSTDLPRAMVVKGVALIGWLAWAVVMAGLGSEVAERLRRHPGGEEGGDEPARAAALSGPLQPVLAQLVGAAMLLAPLARPGPAAAHPEPPPAALQPLAPAPVKPPPPTAVDEVARALESWRAGGEADLSVLEAAGYRVHVVQRYESLAVIAEEQLGDGDLWPRLWALNRGSRQGQGRFADPGLIYRGWRLVLPPPPSSASPSPGAAAHAAPPPPAGPTPARNPSPPMPATTAPVPPPPTPAATPPAAPPGAALEVTSPSTSPERQPSGTAASRRGPSLAERIGWMGGSAVLAAGVVQVVSRLRRRHHHGRGDGALRRPPTSVVHLDLALRSTEGLDDVGWAAATLRQLSAQLRPRRAQPFPGPRLLELSADGLEVLWDEPRPDPLEGWTTANGGWSWHRPRALQPGQATSAPAPCPALVTIGTREGRTVLLNLEAVGLLSVSGPSAADVARAMCLELGSTPFADLVSVLVCGLAVDGIEHLDRVGAADMADVRAWLGDRARSCGQELDRRGVPSVFAGRASGDGFEPFEPVVAVVAGERLEGSALEELCALARPGSGTAVVVVAPAAPVGEWALRVEGDQGVLEPLGLAVSVASVSPPVAAQLAVLLDHAAGANDPVTAAPGGDADEEGGVLADVPVGLLDPEAAAIAAPSDDDQDAYRDPPFDVEIRVLGQVEVVGAACRLTTAEVELLVYLATHRHGDTADTILTMVYPEGASPKTFHNRITTLRKKLGRGSDGGLLVPAVTDSRYRVSRLVLTDWDRFLARVRQAEKEPSGEASELLREALELVNGPPFRAGEGYSWALSEGAAGEIEETVKLAARRLAELYLEAGDPSGALWAARRGQLVAETLADAQRLVAVKMQAHVELGNAGAAVAAYRELMAELAEVDPGLDPDPEVLDVYRSITDASARGR